MPRKRSAITLIEVMAISVILAVVVGTMVPQFSNSKQAGKIADLKYNLHEVRVRVELYRDQHVGSYPPATSGEQFRRLLTEKTNAVGELGADDAKWGPYLASQLPENPFKQNAEVVIVSGVIEPTSATGTSEGWQYNPRHGWFYPNSDEYFQASGTFTSAH